MGSTELLNRGIATAWPDADLVGNGLRQGFARPLPERVGPYEVLQELGSGGMGTVYLAEQVAPVQRRVAVKLVRDGCGARSLDARFRAEQQTLASLSHPGIVRLLEVGTTDEGRAWFAMEHVAGQPITRFSTVRRLDRRARLDLFLDVCDAVGHVHRLGIVHRDLKPANVLVQELDGRPQVKVLDFGLAKRTVRPLGSGRPLTSFCASIGTPDYMSPEQAGGRSSTADARADVYALGVLLHELLHGARPDDDHGPRPGPDQDLEAIVGKAMRQEIGERYDDARALGGDLRRYLAARPVVARAASFGDGLRKFARRHRAWITGACAAAALLLPGQLGIAALYRGALLRADEARAAESATAQDLRLVRALADQREREVRRAREDLRHALDRLGARRAGERPPVGEAAAGLRVGR